MTDSGAVLRRLQTVVGDKVKVEHLGKVEGTQHVLRVEREGRVFFETFLVPTRPLDHELDDEAWGKRLENIAENCAKRIWNNKAYGD